MNFFFLLFFCLLFTGCYSVDQTYQQIKILMNQEPLSKAIADNEGKPERLEKLKLVKPILDFAEKEIELTPKNSYQKFVELNSPYVSWVVQASSKRQLTLKTWWFPFIGNQPYLGFFVKENAMKESQKLKKENYDVSFGGTKAFSLLGYYPDPLYSSMIDGVSTPNFIETLIHETVHRTIYVKGDYAFNENLANFIARKGTENFLKLHPELGVKSDDYVHDYEKNQIAQVKFNEFLMKKKKELIEFYEKLKGDPKARDEESFLKIRQAKFDEIADQYSAFMGENAKGTYYEYAFSKGKFNNASILAYSVYEQDQKPLEGIYLKSNSNLKQMVLRLKSCLYSYSDSDEKIWTILSYCFK